MAHVLSKPAILPLPKIQLVIRKRNAVILPPGQSSRAPPLPPLPPPLSPPLQPQPPPPPPTVTTEQEELEWAFMNNQFIDISSDRSLSGDNTIEDLESRDLDDLPELPWELRPGGYHNPGTRL